jgi:NAD+ synthase
MRRKIVNWLKGQVRQAKAKGIVLGLSGGIDSCLVACLAKEALGKERVLALILPCHSQKQDLDDARFFARERGIKTKTVDLSPIYDSLMKILPSGKALAKANLKPRLRMLVLYYFANTLNYLVCGTGNKSELAVGYFTKFGDGAVDILPIADLWKGQVRALAREYEITERIIAKPPTAGLWPGQTDEGEMGITYPELDDILGRLERKQRQVLPRDKVKMVKAMMGRSRHKRRGPRICLVRT